MAENRICADCQTPFPIFDEDQKFYELFDVPVPKQCPQCRLVRRLMERNVKYLYYRTCDLTKKNTLSQYHKNQPFPVYSPEGWWSDNWDGCDYGRVFDFNRPFFEQFAELKRTVPHLALFNTEGTMQNSEYNNCTAYMKNCYLVGESDYCEECYYSNLLKQCVSVVDCSVCYECELCYECVDCLKCYALRYSQDCQNCRDSFFLENCVSCQNCIGCINQRNKQFMIFNAQYSKEEFEYHKKNFRLDTTDGVEKLRLQCLEFFKTQPRKNLMAEQNQNGFGNHLFNSKNAFHCFDSVDLEDCRYCARLSLGVKTSMDYNSWGNKAELIYFSSGCGDNIYNLKFCVNCQTNVRDSEYCYELFSSSHCFGCIGLKKKQFCILNKQYSKEEFEETRKRVIEHMKKTGELGEFFPKSFCAHAYNEALAMDVFSLIKEEAITKGYRWLDENPSDQQSARTTAPVPGASACSECGKNFKIIPQELQFYNFLKIPSPSRCQLCRHKTRISKRLPPQLWPKPCAKCGNETLTSYAPDRPEIVYCEKCYLESTY